jgi:ComF family protein
MPERCAFCGTRSDKEECGLCDGCRQDLPWLEHACERCAESLPLALPPGVLCAGCQQRASPVTLTLAPLRYEFPVDAALKALKFRRKLHYAPMFAELLLRALRPANREFDALLPVPLHWRRLASRGFNQAAELARPIARRLGVPLLRGVIRHRPTDFQTGLSARARDKNLVRAFRVKRRVVADHVLIIDDVVTTGATTRHLAAEVLMRGAGKVSVAAVARAAGARR